MLNLSILGYGELTISHVVFDFNGTLAIEGFLIGGLERHLNFLSTIVQVHVLTGDSYGNAKSELKNIDCKVIVLPPEHQGIAKLNYIRELNPKKVITVGNGRNDSQMLEESALGIAVIGSEGLAKECLLAADLIMPDIFSVFETLQHATRLTTSLRS